MKKVIELTSFIILTIVVFTSGAMVNIHSELNGSSPLTTIDDTTGLTRLIKVDSFPLTILPPSSGVQFYKDGIIFLSLSKLEEKMTPNQISFGTVEAYYAAVLDTVAGKHTIFTASSSFSFPSEGMTFSKDYNTLYFTRIPIKGTKEKIFMARVVLNIKNQTDLIEEANPLDFCSDDYNYSHPTLSADGNMMIFASDRKGSEGGMDLFITRRVGEKWSAPENLGKDINTTGNEFYPFLDSENNLFFSSDRLPGLGGYDIFTCKFNGSDWGKPVNLPDLINSGKDDIAFTIDKTDGRMAFFTRREKTGRGEMQLFKVALKKGPGKHELTLSSVFNGKPAPKVSLIAANADTVIKPAETEVVTTKTRTEIPKKEISKKEAPKKEAPKKEEPKIAATIINPNKAAPKNPATPSESVVKQPALNAVVIKPTIPTPDDQKDVVIYRIQILSTGRPKSEKEINLNGKNYSLYEYFYLGAYRYTIGEFRTLPPAIELQKICRQSAYPQAFVVAFKNNTRSTDLKSFK